MLLNQNRTTRAALLGAALALSAAKVSMAQYDAPATYYSSVGSLTGAALKNQLQTIATTGFTAQTFGNARYSADYTDANPNNTSQILLMYTRVANPGTWDGGSSFNREHVWPDSRLGPGANDPSDGYRGPASDQFNLRPCNPGVNSSHSNFNFGIATSTGAYGMRGTYWYPGDVEAGDVARSDFYMATRWQGTLMLVNGNPSSNQGTAGDLQALLRYHYRDVPDTFELRRNHAIYGLAGANSPAISNPYKQSNRNAYVDHPEFVWSVFVDQQNDTQLSVGTPAANGTSTATVTLGRVMRNGTVPAAQNVTLNKAGVDGTYYSVTASNGATSTVNGRLNAFAMDATGSRSIGVGLTTSTATTGRKTGSVVIDNLDITTAGGAGVGANDGNDTINVQLDVLDKRVVTASAVNLGRVITGGAVSANSTLQTSGTDQERTRVNVAATSSTDANGARVSAGSTTLFANEAATGTRTVTGTFASAGAKSGSLSVGVTTAENGGSGLANEGAYSSLAVPYTATVLTHATPSFASSSVINELVIDFGNVVQNQKVAERSFSISNVESIVGFTAGLELDQITPSGNFSSFSTNLSSFGGASLLSGGLSRNFLIDFLPSTTGSILAQYQLLFSDENITGAATSVPLTLTVRGNVSAVPEPTTLALLGMAALGIGRRRRRASRIAAF